jgi:hypothetical protein
MSVIIVFPNGAGWFKANWVFRQLAVDVSKYCGSDSDLNEELEAAQALGALFLDRMERPLGSRIVESLRSVAQDTLDGRIDGWRKTDKREHQIYRECLAELLSLLKQQQGFDGHGFHRTGPKM